MSYFMVGGTMKSGPASWLISTCSLCPNLFTFQFNDFNNENMGITSLGDDVRLFEK